MALKTFVKISTVSNLSDARYCAGMYVDLMGFCLEKHQADFLGPGAYKEITDWLFGPAYVAEFDSYDPEKVLETLSQYPGISFIQVTKEIYLPMLFNSGYQLILKKNIAETADLRELIPLSQQLQPHGIQLLLESDRFISLNEEILGIVRELAAKCAVILGFGLERTNVEQVLELTGIKGISLRGGQEIKPGLKDFDELADILEVLETE
ncbi:phosphoribosylanthranilate isomerase [Lunatimonas salinarum]|uniref:phosphoribosylanthranilate isomerase n=1 Tax=Lunatimonas salinarum TaxID=1774590 RepID=UPI001AE03100|nr:phosphoribosylanthranilate isomerase [Lunatimonas salinarum]